MSDTTNSKRTDDEPSADIHTDSTGGADRQWPDEATILPQELLDGESATPQPS